jgi:NAD(P) transhydrogenase subunit beta|tara:strand:- start:863 stop:2281 length:1419 start_codon:yes stop_codon:yes gene_type:complete
MNTTIIGFAYLLSGVLFILALKGLSSPVSARKGNTYGMLGMAIAVATTLYGAGSGLQLSSYTNIIIAVAIGGIFGSILARKISMTALPQLVAAFHSLVGLAAVFVAIGAYKNPAAFFAGGIITTGSMIEMSLGLAIGAITFSGSVIAFAKLQGLVSGNPLVFKGQHLINLIIFLAILSLIYMTAIAPMDAVTEQYFWAIVGLSFFIGFLVVLPIGGADMPVVVSMLNSYSGWAACGIGFTLQNTALIITGALVGSSGAILSYIMCKGMNRSIVSVLLGGFGGDADAASVAAAQPKGNVKQGSADDASFIMGNAQKVIIVPGYGMAVSQAQHALREMCDLLKEKGVEVRYAIHPVAGRMPGHMNVLLAEANVPYDEVFELEEINHEFATADVAFVIGANDVTNPLAKTDPQSPIYGMPILDVEKAATTLFLKRSMASGYAGVDNDLFFRDKTMMLLGDAKKTTEEIVQALNLS